MTNSPTCQRGTTSNASNEQPRSATARARKQTEILDTQKSTGGTTKAANRGTGIKGTARRKASPYRERQCAGPQTSKHRHHERKQIKTNRRAHTARGHTPYVAPRVRGAKTRYLPVRGLDA